MIKAKISEKAVNDGLWHDVLLQHEGETGRAYLDQDEFIRYSSDRKSAELNLASGSLYLGALNQSSKYPKEFWSGKLGFGFQGCIRGLELNDKIVDLWSVQEEHKLYGWFLMQIYTLITLLYPSIEVKRGCESLSSDSCSSVPCWNGGKCINDWSAYTCDCRSTSFTGKNCNKRK